MDRKDINLDVPAFEETPVITEDGKPAEQKVDEEVTPTTTDDVVEPEKKTEPERVPYSRFEQVYKEKDTFRIEAEQAKKDAEYYRSLYESKARETKPTESDSEVPSWWTELYGDSEQAKRGYELRQREIAEVEERAEQRALRAIEERQNQEKEKISTNEQAIDSRMNILSEYLGRPLTEDEQLDILDIADEYTPKDDQGNYLGELISFDKAWEIRELKESQKALKTKGSRDAVASMSAKPSQGEPKEQEEEFVPGRWGSWRKRQL